MVRSKHIKNTTTSTANAGPVEKKKVSGWDKSKFNPTEHRKLNKVGCSMMRGGDEDSWGRNDPQYARRISGNFR
jgi:hypothetical protein